MEAIHALNNHMNSQKRTQGLGVAELDLNAGREDRNKKQINPNEDCLREMNSKVLDNNRSNFSRSSSKKFTSNINKLKRQISTPGSTIMEDDRGRYHRSDTKGNIRSLKWFLKINDTVAAVLGIMGLFFAIVEYEFFYDDTHKPRYSSTDLCTVLRSFVSITTAVVIILLIVHSVLSHRLDSQQHKTNQTEESSGNMYFSSNQFKQLILEIIIIGIHCPPKLDYSFTVRQLGASLDYSIDGIFMICMLLRFYLVFRLFAQYSKWTNELAEHSCKQEGCEANTSFAMKAVLKEKPFTSLLCLMIISCIIFGLAVRHFERPYYYGYDQTTTGFQDYTYIWNGMWLIMITMMTVGYGDFFPKTHMGRFVCILACFWGVFLVSMMVVTLTVVSSFEEKESKAYDILFRLNIKQNIRKKAAFVVLSMVRMRVLRKKFEKGKMTKEQYTKERIILKSKLDVRLQYYRDAVAKISEYEITAEESLRQLTEKIDRDLDEVKEILLSLIEKEKQLNEIELSQMTVATAMNECINFTNNLEEHLNEYKEKVLTKIEAIKLLKNKSAGMNELGHLDNLKVKTPANNSMGDSTNTAFNKLISWTN